MKISFKPSVSHNIRHDQPGFFHCSSVTRAPHLCKPNAVNRKPKALDHPRQHQKDIDAWYKKEYVKIHCNNR